MCGRYPPRVVIDPPRNPGSGVIDPPRGPGRAVIDPPRGSGPGKVIDPPRLSCGGGTVRNGHCHCPPKHKAVQAGHNAWRCVSVVDLNPPRKKVGAEVKPKREAAS